jgi:hypothetical protein
MPFTTIRRSGSQQEAQQTSVSNTCAGKARAAGIDILKKTLVAVGISQAMLAALMLFTGGVQLVLPIAEMAKPEHSVLLACLISIARSLQGLGLTLTLPGLRQTVLGMIPLFSLAARVTLVGAAVMAMREHRVTEDSWRGCGSHS